jgi:tetratricopeptide (TPR) repeat protein
MAPNGAVAEQVYQVPWKLLQPSDPAPARGLVLYWFPASVNEFQNSSLRSSRDLSLYAAQCVTMAIADAGSTMGSRFEVAGKAPVAVLAEAGGSVIGRAEGDKGFLRAPAVEKLVRDEVKKREDTVNAHLTDAKTRAKAGDNAGAVDAYKAVWEQRCLFPKKGKDAAKELKRLGAGVEEGSDSATLEPVFLGPRAAEVLQTMTAGLAAELKGRYLEAADLYAKAQRLDPADPTPPRYLGELYRHHTGEWQKARAVFEELLRHPIDPLTRAVALHGLGKMTIHEGRFDKGRELIEESVRAYPLPLAYRNLAVYWNSEGDPAKTAAYVKLALNLDPDDPYNRVFAAVFYAQTGRVAEALEVATANQALLPASYNLAAIHALAGQREQALQLLKRHFYSYERFAAVRGEEMMEARVDAVFVSLRQDPEFLKLTALADGKLAMPMTAH